MTLRRLTLFASAIALVAATSTSIDATAEIVYRATSHLHAPTQTTTPVETALAITASGSTRYAYAAPWSLHFTANGGTAPYTFGTENFPAGVTFTDDGKVLTVAGVAAKGAYDDIRVLVRDAAGTQVTHSFSASVSDPVNALSIAGLGAPDPRYVNVGDAIDLSFAVSGGAGPYQYSATGIPSGLRLTPTGEGVGLQGTPSVGIYGSARLQVTDAGRSSAFTPNFRLFVVERLQALGPVASSLAIPHNANWNIDATPSTGGGGTKSFSIAPALPAGVAINASTGLISGKPSGTPNHGSFGPYEVTIRDASSTGARTPPFTIVVGAPLTIATPSGSSLSRKNDEAWSLAATGSGGNGTKTYSLASGRLPTGVTLNTSSGAITGTPTQTPAGTTASSPSGTYGPFRILVRDTSNTTGVQTDPFSVVVAEPVVAAMTWGWNVYGQMGNGARDNGTVPIAVSGGEYTSVTSGFNHSCGVRPDKTIWCWGYGVYGELGNGGVTQFNPSPVKAEGGDYTQVAAGGNNTCGLKSDGSVWCWGRSSSGQTGVVTDKQLTPRRISGSYVSVHAGASTVCGIRTGKTLWCWGSNANRQIANSTTANIENPTQIPGTYDSVSVGTAICGITGSTLKCWGGNSYGGIGNGTTDTVPVSSPHTISGSWKNVVVGNLHTCAVNTSSQVSCWGWHYEDRLGYTATQPRLTPTRVTSITGVESVSAGNSTCALKTNGEVWCWGSGLSGQHGDGKSTSSSITPVRAGTTLFKSLSLGGSHAIGMVR